MQNFTEVPHRPKPIEEIVAAPLTANAEFTAIQRNGRNGKRRLAHTEKDAKTRGKRFRFFSIRFRLLPSYPKGTKQDPQIES